MYKIFVVKDIVVDVIDMMGNIHHKTVRLKKRMFFFSQDEGCVVSLKEKLLMLRRKQ